MNLHGEIVRMYVASKSNHARLRHDDLQALEAAS